MRLLTFFALTMLFPLTAMDGYLTDKDITQFYADGYLLKKGCLGEEEISALKVCVDRMIANALLAAKEPTALEQMVYLNGSRIVYNSRPDGTSAICRINGVSGMEPALLNTLRSEKMVRTFFALLGTNDIEHLISQMHPKLPGDGVSFQRHRDIQFRQAYDPEWEDVLGNGSYAICTIAIEPMTEANGGLWVDKSNFPEFKGEAENIVWIDANPGDLLFMHPYLYHGSGPNPSLTQSRKSLLTGFCALGANHKPYPGADVNQHLTLQEDGSILSRPSPWAKKPVTTEGHH